MSTPGWMWHSPPGWPQPPPGWAPPPGWQPRPEWPQPPASWAYWVPIPAPAPIRAEPIRAEPIRVEEQSRRGLIQETWFVQVAFLLPGIANAVTALVAHIGGVSGISPFSTVVPGHPLENFFVGLFSYLAVGALVPLALLLLARTGQGPGVLGFGTPSWSKDLWPGLGIAAMAYGVTLLIQLPLAAVLAHHHGLFGQVSIGNVPRYYIIYGVALAAVTAITEETLVNGYLLTRLEQFGWTPRRALLLSLTLRTSYHVYYGLGFLLTIPFGYFVTRSFQKHRRLNRPIVAHFIYDAVLITIGVLTS